MDTEDILLQKVRGLPPGKREEVLRFVESLARESAKRKPLRSVAGLWSDLGIEITEQDIADARREMWGSFPKEDS
jgi:hypothetical protein